MQISRQIDVRWRRVFTSLAVAVCGVAMLCGAAQASTVDFDDTFDYPNGTSLNGTNGWSVSGSGTVTAQSGEAHIVNSDTNDVTLANTFSDAQKAVSISFDLQPVYSEGIPSGAFPADSTFVFYVDTNGIINAYDGGSVTSLVHDAVSDQVMTNFQVHVDYVISKWSISVGSVEVGSDLAFYSGSSSSFSELAFRETGLSATSVVDNVDINAEVPATTTTVAATTTTAAATTTTAAATTTTTTVVATSLLPFEEPFDALTNGNLNTQRDWVSTDAVVQSAVTRGGKACSITNANGKISHDFIGTYTNVWTKLDIRPVRGEPGTPPAGATFAYSVNSNGVVMAYNGATATNLTGTFVPVDAWVRFETHSDYANTNWDLYLNGSRIAEDLGFYSEGVSGFTEVGVHGVTTGVTYVDNIYVGEVRPPSQGCVLIIR
jgi:hypothetical protein